MKMDKIQEEMKNLLEPISQVNKRDLSHFKIDFIRLFRNFTSQISKAPEESVTSTRKDVFINNQNSNNDKNGENFFK